MKEWLRRLFRNVGLYLLDNPIWAIILVAVIFVIDLAVAMVGLWHGRTFSDDVIRDDLRGAIHTGTMLFLLVALVIAAQKPKPLIASRADQDQDIRRRRNNKRWNERLKLFANAANAVAGSTLFGLLILPVVRGGEPVEGLGVSGIAIAFIAHMVGQFALTFWRTEE